MWFSSMLRTVTTSGLVEFQALCTLSSFSMFFPLPWVAWSHACTNQFSAQYLRRICKPLESYFCTASLSLVLRPVNPSHLALPRFPVLSPQLAVVGLTSFVSHLLGISLSLTEVQCLKNYCFTYLVWICCRCCKWEVNQSLLLHLDWKWKVLKLHFKINFFLIWSFRIYSLISSFILINISLSNTNYICTYFIFSW